MDEQPPPPGDESELPNLQTPKAASDDAETREKSLTEEAQNESSEVNGSKAEKAEHHHHHHHKKSRGKNYETSSDDKKSRDKKKRKKSKEHEKKKSKKERKMRSEKDKDKKTLSKAGTPELTAAEPDVENREAAESFDDKVMNNDTSKETEDSTFEEPTVSDLAAVVAPPKPQNTNPNFKRSDSVLDINPNIDLELDEWTAPEVSKWEREEIKSTTSLENSEADVGNGDVRKNPEEKVTSEILKRAENAIFARAISAIRPVENKKVKATADYETSVRKESSPMSAVIKRTENASEAKLHAFQVTVPANDSGTRSVEIRTSDKAKKSPMRASIKNRLGIKIVEKSRSKSAPRSPKRRLQSDCTKVVRSSRDGAASSRPHAERSGRSSERYPSPDGRRSYNKQQLSSCIKVSQATRDSSRSNRSKYNDKKRSLTPEDRKASSKRLKPSRSRSSSRHRRSDQKSEKPNAEKSSTKKGDEKRPKAAAEQLLSDSEKAKTSRKDAETAVKKRNNRDSSSSSTASTSSDGSQKHSKRHSKHKKKSRSQSVESNGNAKRKKSKKEKKAKKKKKSRK